MAKKKFEKALQDLENIVEKLEDPDLPLDDALSLFEQGIKLSRTCSERLEEAEKKVEILLQDEDGNITTEPFDAQKDEG